MNEEALQTMYSLAQKEGYSDSREDFIALLNSNKDAFNTMYSLAQRDGYNDSKDDFAVLLGVKKKRKTEPSFNMQLPTQDPLSKNIRTYGGGQQASQQGTSQPFTVSKEKAGQAILSATRELTDEQMKQQGIEPLPQQVKRPPVKKEQRIITEDVYVSQQSYERAFNNYLSENKDFIPKNAKSVNDIFSGVAKNKNFATADIPFAENYSGLKPREKIAVSNESIDAEQNLFDQNLKNEIISQLPEEKRNDKKYLRKVEKDLWDKYKYGIDLSGDGAFNRQSMLADAGISLLEGVNNMGAASLYLLSYANPVNWVTGSGDAAREELERAYDAQKEMFSNMKTIYEKDMLESFESGDWQNFAGQVLNTTAQSAPMMLAAAGATMATGTPYAGWVAMSTLSGTQTYLDVKDEDFFKEMTPLGQAVYLTAVGGAEGVGEMISGRVLTNIAKSVVRDAATETAEQTLKQFTISSLKGMGVNISEETVSEIVPSLANYWATEIAKGNEITLEGTKRSIKEGALSGASMGGLMTGAGKAISTPIFFANRAKLAAFDNRVAKLIEEFSNAETAVERNLLGKEIVKTVLAKNKELINAEKTFTDKMTPEEQKVYSESMAQVEASSEILKQLKQGTEAYAIERKMAEEAYQKISEIEQKYAQPITEQQAETTLETEQSNQEVTNREVTSEVVAEQQTNLEQVEAEKADALKDVESTAKALEGVDIAKTIKGTINGLDVWVAASKAGSEHNDGIESYEQQISDEEYFLIDIPIDKILERDADVKNFVENDAPNYDEFKKQRQIKQPIIIGGLDRGGSFFKEGVLDGGNRVAQAKIGNNQKTIKAYVPIRSKYVSEAYHKAKADGSNPELVQAVETLLKPKEYATQEIKQPKGVRTEPEGGIKGGETKTPSVSDSVQRAKESEKEREVRGEKPTTPEERAKQVEPTETEITQTAQKAGVTPKNLRDLYKINRELFGLDRIKSLASAIAMDRMVGAMAKRAGVTKEQMYGRLKFEKKTDLSEIPFGIQNMLKFQAAMHGSPYVFPKEILIEKPNGEQEYLIGTETEFPKVPSGYKLIKEFPFGRFRTEKIGTGEGAQAFGWGLYFTDLESIARGYATSLARQQLSEKDIKKWRDIQEEILPEDFNGDDTAALYAIDVLESKVFKNDFVEPFWLKGRKLTQEQRNEVNRIVSKYESKIPITTKPIVYKVSIHEGKTPDQYTWLEWDKPIGINELDKIISQAKKEGNVDLANNFIEIYDEVIKDKYLNGKDLYIALSNAIEKGTFKTDKEASLFLLRAGIDGMKYPAESISRGATSDTARGFNYVVFDENAVSIEEVIKFQKDAEKARGAMMMALDGQAIIYALSDPNVSTPLHELAHVFEHYLTEAERNSVLKWANATEWTTEVSEKFARGFEKYLADGKAPTASLQKIFDRFKEWLTDIYNGITGSSIDIELNNEMRAIYDKMLGGEEIVAPKKKTVSEAKDIADKLRKTKFVQSIQDLKRLQNDPLGLIKGAWDGAIEVAAKTIEVGGSVAQAINDAVAFLKETDWYKGLKQKGAKNQAISKLKDGLKSSLEQIKLSVGYDLRSVPKAFHSEKGIRVAQEISNIINKVIERRAGKDVKFSDLLSTASADAVSYLKGTKFYEEADDITREEAVRATKKLAMQAVKKSPTAEKVLGKQAADTFSTTINQWYKDLEKTSKDTIKEFQSVVERALENMPKGFSLSSADTKSLLRAASKVLPSSEASVNDFIDYAKKMFLDGKYRSNVAKARSMQKTFMANIKKSKIIDTGGFLRLISLQDPKMLSETEIYEFLDFLEKYSKKRGEILQYEIDAEALDIMNMFNDRWVQVKEKAEKVEKETKESEVDNKIILQAIENIEVENFSQKELPDILFLEGLKDSDLDKLSDNQKKDLIAAINNISSSNKFTNQYAKIKQAILKNRAIESANNAIKDPELNNRISSIFKKTWRAIRGRSYSIAEQAQDWIYSTPLHSIDLLLKGMNNQKIYKTFILPISEMGEALKGATRIATNSLNLDEILRKNGLKTTDKQRMEIRIKLDFIKKQLMHKANPNYELAKSVDEYIEQSEAYANTPEGKKRTKYQNLSYYEYFQQVKAVYDKYTKDGKFDINKALDDTTEAEGIYLEYVAQIEDEVMEMEIINARNRGEDFVALEEHSRLLVANSYSSDLVDMLDNINGYLSGKMPNPKSGGIKARENHTKGVFFNIEDSALTAFKSSATQYYMFDVLLSINSAINKLMSKEGLSENEQALISGIQFAIKEAVDILIGGNFVGMDMMNPALELLIKRGYQSVLARPDRAGIELATNVLHATMFKGEVFWKSALNTVFEVGDLALDVATNIKSINLSRLFDEAEAGKFDEGFFSERKSKTKYGKFVDKTANLFTAKPDQMIAKPLFFGQFEQTFKQITGKKPNWGKIAINDRSYFKEYGDAIQKAKEKADNIVIQAVASNNPFESVLRTKQKPSKNALALIGKLFDTYFLRFRSSETASMIEGMRAIQGQSESLSREEGARLMAATVARMAVYDMYRTAFVSFITGSAAIGVSMLMGGEDEDEEKMTQDEIDFKNYINGKKTSYKNMLEGGFITQQEYDESIEIFDKYATSSSFLRSRRSDALETMNPATEEGVFNAKRSLVGTAVSLALGRWGNWALVMPNFLIEQTNKYYGGGVMRSTESYNPYKDALTFSVLPTDPTFGKPKTDKEKQINFVLKTTGPYNKLLSNSLNASFKAMESMTFISDAILNVDKKREMEKANYLDVVLTHNAKKKEDPSIFVYSEDDIKQRINSIDEKYDKEKEKLYNKAIKNMYKVTTDNAIDLATATRGLPMGSFFSDVVKDISIAKNENVRKMIVQRAIKEQELEKLVKKNKELQKKMKID